MSTSSSRSAVRRDVSRGGPPAAGAACLHACSRHGPVRRSDCYLRSCRSPGSGVVCSCWFLVAKALPVGGKRERFTRRTRRTENAEKSSSFLRALRPPRLRVNRSLVYLGQQV